VSHVTPTTAMAALRSLATNRTSLVLVFVFLLGGSLASRGDESVQFRSCVRRCREVERGESDAAAAAAVVVVPRCHEDGASAPEARVPFSWDCESECQYRCMWAIEGERADQLSSHRPEKYFGKWPFVRLGPMQEPASVVLSLANLVANGHCLVRLVRIVRSHSLSKRDRKAAKQLNRGRNARLWLVHFVLAVNAWTWSAVFHGRDLRVTERLDYFSAGAVMVFDVYLSCLRVSGVSNVPARLVALCALVAAYGRHMYYMHFFKFDYGYHVCLCVAAGVAQSMLWIGWLLFSAEGRSHPGRRYLWAFVVGVNAAVLFEILDFPPVWHAVDAHALWHLATVPLQYVLWGFVSRDTSVNAIG